MKRLLFVFVLTLALFIPFSARSQGGSCGQCASGAQTAGAIAFNALRDAGETDEYKLSCAYKTAQINYGYDHCPNCDWIQMVIEGPNPCMM